MFEQALRLLPEQGGSQDIVTTINLFEDRRDLVEHNL